MLFSDVCLTISAEMDGRHGGNEVQEFERC